MNPSHVIVDKTLNATAEQVWSALTEVSKLKQWFFDLSDFKPEVGFSFQFTGQGHKGDQYVHHCMVTEVVPLKKLQYTWHYEGLPGNSLVTIELQDLGEQTHLKLAHTGLETFPQNNPDFEWSSFNGGWNHIMGSALPEYLQKSVEH